ncbi:rhodanese-like domain-containing protein [Phenylobacterium sp.]|uniref:rhodanese-like domain-containing protein n=1 Tax=Phenylobacterium sp. TaxID=1871053 RepID=UPI0019B24EF5|nr:rhodanese-like domain-containing protein [Phenylobacterium sp.]MBC7168886.1 rhodanese-like domain-containing protein [Phenylobacterium sp.]
MADLVELEPAEVEAMLTRGDCVLVDVREPYEYGAERIPAALLMPLATFDAKALPTMTDKKVVLQCGTGRRSAMAAQKMQQAGYTETYHLKGGITAWREAKLPLLWVNPTTGAIEPKKY